jgi:tetratricopeptide (TPR) repeat protein
MPDSASTRDRYGMTISTSSPAAAQLWLEGVDLLLSQNYGPDLKFQEAIDLDEGFALAHAGLAYMLMLQGQTDAAREVAATAMSRAGGITRRESQQIQATSLFVNGKGRDSIALVRQHLWEYPRDAVMMRLAQRLFMLGCSGAGVPNFPEELLALLQGVESANGDDWAFLGQYAFAHHETGRLDRAMTLARRSLDQYPTNAVASHSVTHVFFEKGQADQGSDFLGNWLQGFDHRAPYRVHLSWHQALFQMAQGRYQQALQLYQEDIRPSVVARSAASLADSASLLWRWQLYGGEPPPVPWAEVRDQAATAAGRPGPAFRDAHAALAFAAAGDTETLDRMTTRLATEAEHGNVLAQEVTLPLGRGIAAFAQGDYAGAAHLLEPLYSQLTRIGGSHAQREVFEDTLLEAYLRAEQFEKAQDMLHLRLKQRASVRDTFWLARAQAGQGQTEAASASVKDAASAWRQADRESPELRRLRDHAGHVG